MSLPALRGPVSLMVEASLSQILYHFPKRINYAFAYGSAVFAQTGQTTGKMVDLVIVVDSPVDWHKENLAMNRDHYSALRMLGPAGISYIQENMASGVYYNPFVKVGDRLIKYGVISTSALERDLNTWNKIYIAGRLHKPVLDLIPPVSATLKKSLQFNRETALRAVLLQEGRLFSKFDLFHGITELSYLGDSRMGLGENPDKTRNIVTPLMAEFERVYAPLLQEMRPMCEPNAEGILVQNTRPKERFLHLMALPNNIQISLCRQLFRDPRLCDIEEIMAEISYLPNLRRLLRHAIKDVVRKSSILQTFQGLLSAGFSRSWQYTKEKLKKGREGRRLRRERREEEDLKMKELLQDNDKPTSATATDKTKIPVPAAAGKTEDKTQIQEQPETKDKTQKIPSPIQIQVKVPQDKSQIQAKSDPIEEIKLADAAAGVARDQAQAQNQRQGQNQNPGQNQQQDKGQIHKLQKAGQPQKNQDTNHTHKPQAAIEVEIEKNKKKMKMSKEEKVKI